MVLGREGSGSYRAALGVTVALAVTVALGVTVACVAGDAAGVATLLRVAS